MCLRISLRKKYEKNNFLASLKSLKKGVGSGVKPGPISQRCGSRSAPKCHGSPTLKSRSWSKTLIVCVSIFCCNKKFIPRDLLTVAASLLGWAVLLGGFFASSQLHCCLQLKICLSQTRCSICLFRAREISRAEPAKRRRASNQHSHTIFN